MSFNHYKCGLVQLNSGPDIDSNLNQASEYIQEAATAGARLVCLPECTPYLGPEEHLLSEIESIENKFYKFLKENCEKYNITIAAGGYRRSKNKHKVHNCLIYMDPTNKKTIYDKVHLFDVTIPDGVNYQESKIIDPGKINAMVLQDSPFGNLGFSICYDVRFPEMYRQQVKQGANVLLIPAAFTAYTGAAHWHTLIRARAIENLSFVLAPAQTGIHFGKRESFGHTMVVDPWGQIVGELGSKPGILLVDIDFEKIKQARAKIPSTRSTNIKL